MSIKRRLERLEQRTPPTAVFGVAEWLQWRETGQPEPPAELLELFQERLEEVSETMRLYEN